MGDAAGVGVAETFDVGVGDAVVVGVGETEGVAVGVGVGVCVGVVTGDGDGLVVGPVVGDAPPEGVTLTEGDTVIAEGVAAVLPVPAPPVGESARTGVSGPTDSPAGLPIIAANASSNTAVINVIRSFRFIFKTLRTGIVHHFSIIIGTIILFLYPLRLQLPPAAL